MWASVSCIWVPLARFETNSNCPSFAVIEAACPLCHGEGMGSLAGLFVNDVAGNKKESDLNGKNLDVDEKQSAVDKSTRMMIKRSRLLLKTYLLCCLLAY